MTVTLITALTVAAVQAVVLPLVLSWFKQGYVLAEILILALISGLLYLVPTVGATLSFAFLIGGLYWRSSGSTNLVVDVVIPVSIARLACLPVLMALR